MSDEKLLEVIKEFTQDQAGRDPKDIKENSFLEKDLGIYGDDAMEYILAFGKRFNVDVSSFMATDYFSSEGFSLRSIFNFFIGKQAQEQKKGELSIAHLIKAIKAGRLDEEIINT